MLLYTYSEEGEIENENINIQLKATEHLSLLQDGQTIPFLVDRADLEYWRYELFPVILIVYDAVNEIAYWTYIQAYFQQRQDFNLELVGTTYTIHIPRSQVVNLEAIRQFALFKAQVLLQIQGAIRNEG